IGQMISRKNITAILDVFSELAEHNPALQLELIGDGNERDRLERYARTLAAHDRIHFRGFVDNPLIHLQELDLFLMTSTLEGTPLCLMEAMAMGVPAVAFKIPGIDLLIEQGETGFVTKLGDHAGLVAYCEQLLDDPGLARRLATAARQRILEHFSAERMADEYLSLYRSLVRVSD